VALLVGIASISRRWTARLADTAEASTTVVEERAPEKEKAHASASTKTADSSATASAATSASSATPSAKAGVADATVPAEADSDVTASTKGADSEPAGDSKRAAQLARQQAAVDTTRQKRLRDADPVRFGLRRSVLAEAAVAIVVLAVTTALTTTEPGRTEEDAKAAKASSSSAATSSSGALTLDMSFDTGGTDGKGVIRLDLDPARVGGNEMHVYVQRPNGRAFDVPEVKVAFTLAAKKIGPLPVTPDRIATGHWAANGIQIPMAGEWKISVTVRTSDIDQTTVDKNAQIG
jgi:copper transport protein